MSVHWNPAYYLKHAWEKTHSIWGKICIVLFYLFVWLNILAAVIQALIPTSQGIGCYLDAAGDEYSRTILQCWLVDLNIFIIFFLLYADRGGIKFWNVLMVFVAFALYGWTNVRYLHSFDFSTTAAAGCANDSYKTYNWINILWPALAAICAFLEERADPGTSDETQPLNP